MSAKFVREGDQFRAIIVYRFLFTDDSEILPSDFLLNNPPDSYVTYLIYSRNSLPSNEVCLRIIRPDSERVILRNKWLIPKHLFKLDPATNIIHKTAIEFIGAKLDLLVNKVR